MEGNYCPNVKFFHIWWTETLRMCVWVRVYSACCLCSWVRAVCHQPNCINLGLCACRAHDFHFCATNTGPARGILTASIVNDLFTVLMAVYCTTTTINEKMPHSQAMGEQGGGGYFLPLTLSELGLLLSPDKLLHTLPGDRQNDSAEDSCFYTLRVNISRIDSLFDFVLLFSDIVTLLNSYRSRPACFPAMFFTNFDVFLFPAFPTILFLFCYPLLFSPSLSLALWITSLKQWAVAGTLLLTMGLKASCLPIARVFISCFIYPVFHLSGCC